MTQERLHIFPIETTARGGFRTTHSTDKTGMCWCKPRNMQVCPDADMSGRCDADCWRCHGESMVAASDPEQRVLIIHSNHQRKVDDLDNYEASAYRACTSQFRTRGKR